MNASVLAKKMLQWEEDKLRLDVLETEIEEAVLEIGRTQTAGNVRASYSGGRKMNDYQAAIEAADLEDDALAPFEKVSIDYRSACESFGIKDVPFTKSEPKVTVKLLK